jgi:hypothetical protein
VLRHGTISADLTGGDVNEARITRELLMTKPQDSGATNAETQIS